MEISDAVQIAAIAAPVVAAALVAWFTAGHAQALSREERVQRQRADAYIELADLVVRIRQYAATAFPGVEDGSPVRAPPIDEDQRWRILGLVEAYGSQEIVDRYDHLQTQMSRVRTTVSHVEDMRQLTPPFDDELRRERTRAVEDMRASREGLSTACSDLLQRLNAELRGEDHHRRFSVITLILVVAVTAGAAGAIGYVVADDTRATAPTTQPSPDRSA